MNCTEGCLQYNDLCNKPMILPNKANYDEPLKDFLDRAYKNKIKLNSTLNTSNALCQTNDDYKEEIFRLRYAYI